MGVLKNYESEKFILEVYDVRRPDLPPSSQRMCGVDFDSEHQNHDLIVGPGPAEDGSSLGTPNGAPDFVCSDRCEVPYARGEQLGGCFPHFHRLIHLVFTFLDEAAPDFQFYNFHKRKMVPPEHQNLDPRVDPEVDPAFGASGPQTEPWIFHDSTATRCHTLGGST